ncbi:MAG: RCC1 domain-containing protein, partial [Myxococcota bacterium]
DIGTCEPGFEDCNRAAEDGCEQSLTNGVAQRCNGGAFETCTAGSPWQGEPCGVGCDEDTGCLTVRSLAAGGGHTCAVLSDDSIWCWGDNAKGQLGIGATTPTESPTPVRVGGAGAESVTLGHTSSCAVDDIGALACWGDNSEGQLGTGGTTPLFAPPLEPALMPVQIADAGTWTTACAVLDGQVWCFGTPFDATSMMGANPTEMGGVSSAAMLAVGTGFACASRANDLRCWGDDSAGQLGNDETLADSGTPVKVGVEEDWAGLGAGDLSAYAFTTDGKVYAWGDNGEGQLGTGLPAGAAQPTEVPLPPSVVEVRHVDGGRRHACVHARDDLDQLAVYCFGSNEHGKLGQGSTVGGNDTPLQVLESPGVPLAPSRIAVGWEHNCAVTEAESQIVCWGLNDKGQLGDGSYASSGYPVRVDFP